MLEARTYSSSGSADGRVLNGAQIIAMVDDVTVRTSENDPRISRAKTFGIGEQSGL
jgi:hypothetical protein